jgi:hypothetical protein
MMNEIENVKKAKFVHLHWIREKSILKLLNSIQE